MPGVKRGSINDVNAVGNRKIGARGLGNWYSADTEMAWGSQIAQQVQKSAKIIHDPVVDEYVNRVGQNIVKNSDAKVPFTIKVIDTDEINAFALPGGYFFVNAGLILAADNEAELAGAMAHEIAHVAAHHQAREMTRMHYADLGMVPLVMMTGYSMAGYGIYEASAIAVPLTFLQFQRDFEAQADWLGVQYLYKAGYDPQQLIAFFEKIEALEKARPRLISKTFATHPQTPARVQRTQHEIGTILPPRQEYVVDTSEFHQVQARLLRMENRRPLKDGTTPAQPTLRRVGSAPDPAGSVH
ncbi:MAG TPA: M48 family metallopeptidase [Acidobacteriaceae bacterium]|nr:M48 family metallopeptidase [Acidobacteriaceae bacterium]